VAATVLAKRFNVNSWSFTRYLKESGRPALAVPIPEEGRRPAFFLLNALAAEYSSEALRNCKRRGAPEETIPQPRSFEGVGLCQEL